MVIQIFSKKDGRPHLSWDGNYDKEKYIEDMPPSELYEPITYENGEWVGTDYETYKENLDKEIEEELIQEGLK